MDDTNLILWIFLIIFFILAIIYLFFYYSYSIYLISPSQCYANNAEYSILTGKDGEINNQCYGIGADPSSSDCTFINVSSTYSAIQLCNNNPESCKYFSINGSEVNFLKKLYGSDPSSIVYVHNI